MTQEELNNLAVSVRKIIKSEEQERLKDRKVIATRDWLDKHYGEAVIRELTRKKLLFPYAFGTKEIIDPDGNPIKKRKGAVYYRVADVEDIIEDYNTYKTLQESYKRRRLDFKDNIRKLQEAARLKSIEK